MVWQCISPKVIGQDFKKCCISSVVNGTDDDKLWNDSDEDEDVRSEGTDSAGGDSDIDW